MLLPRHGEFCSVLQCRGQCPRLKGFALSGRGGCTAGRLGLCKIEWLVH